MSTKTTTKTAVKKTTVKKTAIGKTTVAKLDKIEFSDTGPTCTFRAAQGYSFKYSDGEKYGLVFSEKNTGACAAQIVDEPVTVKTTMVYASVLAQFIGRPIRITVELDASGQPTNLTSFELGTV